MNARERRATRPRGIAARRARARWAAAATLVATIVAGCASSPVSTPSPVASEATTATAPAAPSPSPATAAPAPSPTHVATGAPRTIAATIAAVVDESTTMVMVTDWHRILGDTPVPADPAARYALVRGLGARFPVAGFAVNYLRVHRNAWGWDTLDLSWEANVLGQEGSTFVLALRPGADIDAIVAHFQARDFGLEERSGAVLFSHPFDLAEDWSLTTEPAINNTAILAEARLMILSASRPALDRALAAIAGAASADASPAAGSRASAFVAATSALGPADAAIVLLGAEACRSFAPRDDVSPDPVMARLHPWAALGGGWSAGGTSAATGRLAFVYDQAGLATADLAGRAKLAKEGVVWRQPISERLFRLDAAHADGKLLVLDVTPANGLPGGLATALFHHDGLGFAACS